MQPIFRSVWADFLTDDPDAWRMRIGEHNLLSDDAQQFDIKPEAIFFHPDRQGIDTLYYAVATLRYA